jgi:hypothetical protein
VSSLLVRESRRQHVAGYLDADERVFEVDDCQYLRLASRPTTDARDHFDCNPIATQRYVIGRHGLKRAEPPPDENACIDGLFTTVRHSAIRA